VVATGISEFTFGYAFLHEQTERHWGTLRAAPILPSLQQEAELGWDARLPVTGVDYYYQFKLSDYLWRANAKYISDGTYAGPYFRVKLHRRESNRQHGRLREHCQVHPHTFYVAPEFTGLTTFNASFLARQIVDNSRLIPLADCDDVIDGEQHHITYQSASTDWRFHSEFKRHTDSHFGSEIDQLYRKSANSWQPITRGFAEGLFESAAATVERRLVEEKHKDRSAEHLLSVQPPERTRAGYLRRTADLLSMFYGLTLVLVGERPEQNL
jgi:hypothetical protein